MTVTGVGGGRDVGTGGMGVKGGSSEPVGVADEGSPGRVVARELTDGGGVTDSVTFQLLGVVEADGVLDAVVPGENPTLDGVEPIDEDQQVEAAVPVSVALDGVEPIDEDQQVEAVVPVADAVLYDVEVIARDQ